LVFVSCALCAVVYAAGSKLFGPRAGFIAGLITALSPGAVLNSVTILSDTLHAFLLACAFLVLQDLLRSSPPGASLGCGLLLGLSALTRPVSLYTPLIVAPVLWWARRTIKPGLWVILGAFIAVAPWFLRNRAASGRLTFSTIAEHNLWYHNLSYARAKAQGIPVDEARRLYAREVQTSGLRNVVRRDLRRYWKHLVLVQAAGTVIFWVAPDGYQWSYFLGTSPKATFGHDRMWDAGLPSAVRRLLGSPGGIASAVQLGYNAVETILALIGLLVCIRSPDRRTAAVLATAWCLYYAVVTSVVSNGRYRLPAEIVMALFAGAAVDAGLRAVRSRTHRTNHVPHRREAEIAAGGPG